MFDTKRVYEAPSPKDGYRVLVERLWPRGISKDKAKLHLWLKDIAPSAELRKWFNHDPEKWEAFQNRYGKELKNLPALVKILLQKGKEENVTLVYGSRDEQHNSATVLKNYLAKL